MWLWALVACGPAPDPNCESTCGRYWLEDQWVECDPCAMGDDLEELLEPIDHVLQRFAEESATAEVFDVSPEQIREHSAMAFEDEADRDRALITALNRVLQGHRNGHSSLFAIEGGDCTGGTYTRRNLRGACLAPWGSSFLVTQPSDSLGLALGERVVEVNGRDGPALIDLVADGPVCGHGATQDDGRHQIAASALLGVLREGDVLVVESLSGDLRSVEVGPPEDVVTSCRRDPEPWISGYQRPDGVAVIRIDQWDIDRDDPDYIDLLTDETFGPYLETMTARAEEVFDEVTPGATGLIWDIRGNGGGFAELAFTLAAGMPGARPATISTCSLRVVGTNPPVYEPFSVDLVVPDDGRFSFDRPVAALFDGDSFSASDYFAYVLLTYTSVELFGVPTAGAYGSPALGELIPDTPFGLVVDRKHCVDELGVPLESRSIPPHHVVETDPEDLTAGIDTVLEEAAAWISGP